MLRAFEKLLYPYPEATPLTPPSGFLPFLWACTEGLRRYILGMTLCTAVIGIFEAMLFSMMGHILSDRWLPA